MRTKTIHITTELFHINFGGIGTVCNELYLNKNEDEEFVLIVRKKGDDIKFIPNDVTVLDLEQMKYQAVFNADKIIIHNFSVAYEYIKQFGSQNVYYVMHSNIVFERMYGTNLTAEDERKFIEVINKCKVITVSDYEQDLLNTSLTMKELDPIDKNNFITIYNGITLEVNKTALKRNGSLGYIGRLDERKGIFELCNQFKEIKNKKLLLATGGKGKFLEGFKIEFSNIINSSNNIVPLGYCSDKRKESFFNSIDALIIPSLYEPFGMTVLEAGIRNIPIIANKTGGIAEILGEDYPLYFDINNKDSLNNAINKFYSMNEEELLKIINATYDRIGKFSVDNMINGYRNI